MKTKLFFPPPKKKKKNCSPFACNYDLSTSMG